MTPNPYQNRKARQIAAGLIMAACQADTPLNVLPSLLARANDEQWRGLSFAAGQPVADVPCRVLVIAHLQRIADQVPA